MCGVGWTKPTGSPNTAKNSLKCFIFNFYVSWDMRNRGLPDTGLQVRFTKYTPGQCVSIWQLFVFILQLQLPVLRINQ